MAVAEIRFRVMASDAHVIVVDGPAGAGDLAQRALTDLEQAWSRFLPGSDVSRINNSIGFPVAVNEVTITLLDAMVQAWRTTSGRLDPTVLPALLDAGYRHSIDDPGAATILPDGFRAGGGDLSDVSIDRGNRTVTAPYGMAIDPGGIGKGLAADLVVAELLAAGAKGALVSVGGDLSAAGRPAHAEGWTVEVEDPFEPGTALVRLAVSGGGVATSSTLSRRWNQGGTTRHHLIDPATGTVSQTDMAAVSVIAPCGWQAEAHATAIILGGAERFLDYTNSHGLDAIGTTLTGRTIVTEPLARLVPDRVPT